MVSRASGLLHYLAADYKSVAQGEMTRNGRLAVLVIGQQHSKLSQVELLLPREPNIRTNVYRYLFWGHS